MGCPYAAVAARTAYITGVLNVFALCGVLVILSCLAKTIWLLAKNFFVFFLAEPLGLTTNFKKLGEWAVVTGATDGIGKGYALDLARRGCNIVLISRTEEKLRTVAKEIESTYKVLTKIIAVDFATETVYETVKKQLEGLEIGTLINNVGMGDKYPENFHQVEGGEEFFLQMIRCNCVSQTLMTRIVIPQMIARGKGAVVNLSSAAGIFPVPLEAVYSGTKAYNDFFARALQQEYRNKGVTIQVIQPYYVATNMTGIRKTSLFVIGAEAFARSCLNSFGFLTRTNGHPAHAIQNWMVMRIPECIRNRVARRMMERVRDVAVAKLKAKGQWKGQ